MCSPSIAAASAGLAGKRTPSILGVAADFFEALPRPAAFFGADFFGAVAGGFFALLPDPFGRPAPGRNPPRGMLVLRNQKSKNQKMEKNPCVRSHGV
jgi:hypothetical protein